MGDILLRLLNPTETVDDGNTMYDAAKEIEALRDTLASHTSALAERDAEIARLRNKVPALALTDKQLADEIAAMDAACAGGFGEGGGSPGEWWYERADELEHERKRRHLEAQIASLAKGGNNA